MSKGVIGEKQVTLSTERCSRKKRYSGSFKTSVILELIYKQESKTTLAEKYKIAPSLITAWEKVMHKRLPALFGDCMLSYGKTSRELELERKVRHLEEQMLYMSRIYNRPRFTHVHTRGGEWQRNA